MKYILAALTALAFILLPRPAAPASAPYVIGTLDVRLAADDDNSYRVTETYEVTFNARRHGLQRDLPLFSYLNRRVDVRDVSAGGRPFSARRSSGILTVRIGGPEKWAGRNERYVLSYVYDIGGDGMNDMDELYYNLIADYDTRIDEMTFTIEMPHPFDASRLNFTHGEKGSTENTAVEWRVEGTVITGRLKKANKPHEQLTVALPLPEGYYRNAAGRVHAERTHGVNSSLLRSNYIWLSLPAAAVSFLLWYFFCRERKIFPAVEFYPPEGFTPADAAYAMNGMVSLTDVVSMIIYWAGKGYLNISEKPGEKGFTLRKLREIAEEDKPKPYEKKLFDAIFLQSGEVTASNLGRGKFYGALSSARKEAVSFHNEDPLTRIFARGTFKRALLVNIPAAVCLLPVLLDSPAAAVPIVIGFAHIFFLTMFGVQISSKILAEKRKTKAAAFIFAAAFITIYMGAIFAEIGVSLAPLVVPAFLMFKCRRRTDLGLKYLERLTGFKTFLETAERDRIDMLAEENPQYFYDVLPYAAALGVTDTWTEKFEHIVSRPPSWYEGSAGVRAFSASSFSSELSRGLAVTARAPAGSRSSSSSESGGSAGGGSGGGSGSSW